MHIILHNRFEFHFIKSCIFVYFSLCVCAFFSHSFRYNFIQFVEINSFNSIKIIKMDSFCPLCFSLFFRVSVQLVVILIVITTAESLVDCFFCVFSNCDYWILISNIHLIIHFNIYTTNKRLLVYFQFSYPHRLATIKFMKRERRHFFFYCFKIKYLVY